MATMDYELVEFFKGPLIQQELDSLSSCLLARFMSPLDAFLAAGSLSLFVSLLQCTEFPFDIHFDDRRQGPHVSPKVALNPGSSSSRP